MSKAPKNVPATDKADITSKVEKAKRTRVSQSDVPAYSLEDALRVSRAIFENYGARPTKPLDVAKAMELLPGSSQFKMITGASIAYGLTEGAAQSESISLTPLAKQILAPLSEGADLEGKIEAFLRPRVIADFAQKYNGSQLPRDNIAINVIESMGVPRDRAETVYRNIISGAEQLRLITDIKGKRFLNLSLRIDATQFGEDDSPEQEAADVENLPPVFSPPPNPVTQDSYATMVATAATDAHKQRIRKVFITHGKNQDFIEPIKKLLNFGEMEAVVSVEKQSVSQPVPDKVMGDMRLCGAAIIHVDGEQELLDRDTNVHVVLNPNVLIEIGAAMALYGRRFILLVKDGVKLPSNLQGLYEVRYKGDALDGDATIRLLEAIRQLKEVPLTS